MMPTDFPSICEKLASHVKARTGGRLTNLHIQVDNDAVVLQGRATSFYVKQLAQHGVRELLPRVNLQNAIVVS